ncbi:MAG: tRNA glutamyl-Q(34) synthetase GluQRS [Muribaculaceae bacterium]|nr:tRNA glutamyl-Q(34) synthetase GluQRS [Muribaculaceae bacterium]
MNEEIIGRFAPSPTGRMHLGNVFAALLSYCDSKSQGGKWLVRHEDLDPQRSRREYALQIEDDLLWLGLIPDEKPEYQSERHYHYEESLEKLRQTGLTYGCSCTRADILATQAPHQSDGRVIYGGRCRPASLPCFAPEPERKHSVRLYVPDREIRFTDGLYGPQTVNLAQECGDFIVRRADGAWAYQLAVVTDDALMGVNRIVRGSDLLLSAAQQLYLYELLGLPLPEFKHIPLLCNSDGRRLSKRDKSLAMDSLRRDYTPEKIIGLTAHLSGLAPTASPLSLSALTELYAINPLTPNLTARI